jgi:hypothetical protein
MTTGTQGAAPSAAAAATATTAEPPIDMRSDTVTKPTDAMRAVLCAHAYARTERKRKKTMPTLTRQGEGGLDRSGA